MITKTNAKMRTGDSCGKVGGQMGEGAMFMTEQMPQGGSVTP